MKFVQNATGVKVDPSVSVSPKKRVFMFRPILACIK